jgi:MFS family permease
VGGVALQWPLGAISDRFSRRRVIFAATVTAAVAAAWLAMVEATAGTALLVMFLLGGFSFPMYSLSGSHVNDLMGPEHAVGASSAIMLANGLGAVAGPFGASMVMTAAGPSGLWMFVAIVHGILGVYAAWRLIQRWNIPAPGKGHYVPYPARSGGLRYWTRNSS